MSAPKGNQYAKGNPGGPGRKSGYSPELCGMVRELCENGATDFELAQVLEITVPTLYAWKAKHKEFALAIKLGKSAADERVERSLYARAVGYDHPAEKITVLRDGTEVRSPYTEHVPPDPGAISFWLKNRKGEVWRDKQSLEHSGPDGGPIQTETVPKLEASDVKGVLDAIKARRESAVVVTNGNGNGRAH